jgi:hypothetical protein
VGTSALSAYLLLAYLAHTAARVAANLVPTRDPRLRREVRGWLATGFGVGLSLATGVDLLADLGISVVWPPLGLLVTGLLMGQGAQFGLEWLSRAGVKGPPGPRSGAPPGAT